MILDANAYIGNWPFRRMLYRTADEIMGLMDRVGIDRALVSYFDTIFLKEYSRGNRDLSEQVAPHSNRLSPLACINPAFPGWERDLRIAVKDIGMGGIVVYPNYHAYDLKQHGPTLAQAIRETNPSLLVSLQVRLEDQRRAHWLCRVPDVPIDDVVEFLNTARDLNVIIANIKAPEVQTLAGKINLSTTNAFVEISGMESPNAPVEQVVGWIGADRVLFGTYMPLKYPETALLKFRHSDLTSEQRDRILYRNLVDILNIPEQDRG
ncbi:MAG: hypothetical protein AB1696_24330 [Planctomycetota bacterium]